MLVEGEAFVSDQWVRLVWFGMLLLHGVGHGGAMGALAWIAARPNTNTGSWTAAKSWLLSSMEPRTAMLVANAFWLVSLAGFVLAAGLFFFSTSDLWQPIAIASAVVSAAGIVLFFGNWPLFNTIAALAVNVVVVVALVFLRWTPPAG
ncbi:MAG: hypothetical protein AB1627_00180 [Chloroflexota bacterium]